MYELRQLKHNIPIAKEQADLNHSLKDLCLRIYKTIENGGNYVKMQFPYRLNIEVTSILEDANVHVDVINDDGHLVEYEFNF